MTGIPRITYSIWWYTLHELSTKMALGEIRKVFIKYSQFNTRERRLQWWNCWIQSNLFLTVQLVGGCRIHRLHLCKGVTQLPMSVLDMALNSLMVRFQKCFGLVLVLVWCSLVWFYGISTIISYLMPNPFLYI